MSTLAAASGVKTPNVKRGHVVDRIMILWCSPETEMSDWAESTSERSYSAYREVLARGRGRWSLGRSWGWERSKAKEKPSPTGKAASEATAGFKAGTQALWARNPLLWVFTVFCAVRTDEDAIRHARVGLHWVSY